jgi:dTDP-4-dehydrorhamnose 3,5-epimerase
MESYNEQHFHAELGKLGLPISRPFIQDNHSFSKKGVLRGLHYQLPPYEQGKLVGVVKGAVFDVAVDIRKDSSTFGKWVGVELSDKNKKTLWIPEGFAHGFLSLEDGVVFLYKATSVCSKAVERSILWDDPYLDVRWPGLIKHISEKDLLASDFSTAVEDD